MIQVGPGIKQDPISKTTTAKRAGNMVQVVEHLHRKHKVLSKKNIGLQTSNKGLI
jgi:hypothetical protein